MTTTTTTAATATATTTMLCSIKALYDDGTFVRMIVYPNNARNGAGTGVCEVARGQIQMQQAWHATENISKNYVKM
jgi:hypothetical protein